MSCNISIPMEDIIEAVREELAKEFISIENGVGNNTTLNSPNIKGDVTFDSAARAALCSAMAECVDEKLKALEDKLDGKIEDTEAALSQAISDAKSDLEADIALLRKSFEDSQTQQDAAFDAKLSAQKELLENAIASGDNALDSKIDNLDTKVDSQREALENAIEAGDDALGARIDNLDTKVDHQREDLENAIASGDDALDSKIDNLDAKVDHQREDLENAIASGDAALGARIDNLGDTVSSEVSASKITSVTRVSDTVTIKLASGAEYPFSITDETLSKDRPVNFAPSASGENIEITLADGSVLDMTRGEFADWLAGGDSKITTDEELRDAIRDGNQEALDELNDLLAELEGFVKSNGGTSTDQKLLDPTLTEPVIKGEIVLDRAAIESLCAQLESCNLTKYLPPDLIVPPDLVQESFCAEVSVAGANEPEAFMLDVSNTVGVMTVQWITYYEQDRFRLYMDDNMFFDTGCGGNFDSQSQVNKDNYMKNGSEVDWNKLPPRPYPDYPLSEVNGTGLKIDDVANEYSFYIPRASKRLWIEVIPNCKLGIPAPSSAPADTLIEPRAVSTRWTFLTSCPDGSRVADDGIILEKYKTDPLNIEDLRPNWDQ